MLDNYTFGLPIQASTFADKIDQSLWVIHVAMGIIFIFWAIFFTYCLFRFRRSKNPNADSNVNKWKVRSFVPDATILAFEIILIFALGLPIWSSVKEEFPQENESHVVEMVSEQFAWSFQYAGKDGQFGRKAPEFVDATNTLGLDPNDPAGKDDIRSLNTLHVPIGKPTIVYMTSKDVIHSFFVPEFRVKQDTVPGMKIPLWFEPTKIGQFEIGCAQLCGLGHYRMKGIVEVHTQEDYEAKIKEIKKEQEEE